MTMILMMNDDWCMKMILMMNNDLTNSSLTHLPIYKGDSPFHCNKKCQAISMCNACDYIKLRKY